MWRRYLKQRSKSEETTTPDFRDTPLFITLALWLCALPFLVILAAYFLGWTASAYLALLLLAAGLISCWVLCLFRVRGRNIRKF